MTEVSDKWLQLASNAWELGAHDVMHEGRVLTTEEILDLTIGAVLADLRRQVEALPHEYCSSTGWCGEAGCPGGDACPNVQEARAEGRTLLCDCLLCDVLDLLDTGGSDG